MDRRHRRGRGWAGARGQVEPLDQEARRMSVNEVKRRPVRGAIGGLLLGIGVAVLLLVYGKASFGKWTPVIIVGAGLVVGIAVGLAGPTTRREGGPRSSSASSPKY